MFLFKNLEHFNFKHDIHLKCMFQYIIYLLNQNCSLEWSKLLNNLPTYYLTAQEKAV